MQRPAHGTTIGEPLPDRTGIWHFRLSSGYFRLYLVVTFHNGLREFDFSRFVGIEPSLFTTVCGFCVGSRNDILKVLVSLLESNTLEGSYGCGRFLGVDGIRRLRIILSLILILVGFEHVISDLLLHIVDTGEGVKRTTQLLVIEFVNDAPNSYLVDGSFALWADRVPSSVEEAETGSDALDNVVDRNGALADEQGDIGAGAEHTHCVWRLLLARLFILGAVETARERLLIHALQNAHVAVLLHVGGAWIVAVAIVFHKRGLTPVKSPLFEAHPGHFFSQDELGTVAGVVVTHHSFLNNIGTTVKSFDDLAQDGNSLEELKEVFLCQLLRVRDEGLQEIFLLHDVLCRRPEFIVNLGSCLLVEPAEAALEGFEE